RTQRSESVELDHVGDRHPDAAVRRGGAERAQVVGAVDAGAAVDPHPAGLQRVLGAGWDRLAGEGSRPRAVRHVPRRIDLFVLNVVEAGGRLESDSTDGDRVALREL